jgi:hypothetical protein
MFEQSPNGFFVNDMIVFNSLNAGGYVAKGFIFEPPDMANAQASELNDFQDQLSLLLASLTEQQRLQVQYYCDCDYRHELLRYHAETQKADNLWTRRSRNERFERYWRLMTDRKLRRQRLVFYLSRKIEASASGLKSATALTEHYNHLLDQLHSEFEQKHEMLTEIFAGQGARVIAMKDADHYHVAIPLVAEEIRLFNERSNTLLDIENHILLISEQVITNPVADQNEKWQPRHSLFKSARGEMLLCSRLIEGKEQFGVLEKFDSNSLYAKMHGESELIMTGNTAFLVLQNFIESERSVLKLFRKDIEATVEENLAERFPGQNHSRVVRAISARCGNQTPVEHQALSEGQAKGVKTRL